MNPVNLRVNLTPHLILAVLLSRQFHSLVDLFLEETVALVPILLDYLTRNLCQRLEEIEAGLLKELFESSLNISHKRCSSHAAATCLDDRLVLLGYSVLNRGLQAEPAGHLARD